MVFVYSHTKPGCLAHGHLQVLEASGTNGMSAGLGGHERNMVTTVKGLMELAVALSCCGTKTMCRVPTRVKRTG